MVDNNFVRIKDRRVRLLDHLAVGEGEEGDVERGGLEVRIVMVSCAIPQPRPPLSSLAPVPSSHRPPTHPIREVVRFTPELTKMHNVKIEIVSYPSSLRG